MPHTSEPWTEGLSVVLLPGQTLEELVDCILQAEVRKVPHASTIAAVMQQFALTEEDAELAWDRTLGGLVRAASNNSANCPDKETDPVARISYERCQREPAIITAIRPA